MNAGETIQAAVEKLELLRERSTSGAWHVDPIVSRADIRSNRGRNGRGASVVTAADSEFGAASRFDAELIVVLHSTIDAQLALLRNGLGWVEAVGDDGADMIDRARDLARAILGEAS